MTHSSPQYIIIYKHFRRISMKKSLLLLALFIPVIASASEHNFSVHVGGNVNTLYLNVGEEFGLAETRADMTGGGYTVELGYLWKTGGTLLYALDTRLGFGQNFDAFTDIETALGTVQPGGYFQSIFLYLGTTFALGTKIGEGTLLVDALGINLGWINTELRYDSEYYKLGNSFLFSLILPAGIQYIFDMGLVLGLRQRLDFAVGGKPTWGTHGIDSGSYFGSASDQTGYIAYNLTVSVGYSFGL